MKAVYYEGNELLRIGKCVPVQPKANEVQISVHYTGICGTDMQIYHGHMDHRVNFPHIMGHEMSGVVHAVGDQVDHLQVGDRVVVMPLDSCGHCPACQKGHSHICHYLKFIGIETPGSMQTLWTVPSHTVIKIPEALSLSHAALIEPLAVACHDVRLGQVKSGENVVVVGGGPIGALIALTAKVHGARVLVSEINPHRIELLTKMGVDTIHPIKEDLAKYVDNWTERAGCDVVFEVTSSKAGAEIMTQLPRTRGRIVVVGIFNQAVPVDLHRFFWRELTLTGARVYEREDFDAAIQLAASGQLPLDDIITHRFSLNDVRQAFDQMKGGGNAMKVLLSCQE